MKSLLAVFLSIVSLTALHATKTAYEALDDLVAHNGRDALHSTYLVVGKQGEPQPNPWRVFQKTSNGTLFQVQEIQASGKIVLATAGNKEVGLPVRARPINFSVLNLNTDAVWNIATQHAQREHYRFQTIDYELRTHPIAGVPCWYVRLFNSEKETMGEMVLSGVTGQIIHPLKLYRYTRDAQGNLLVRREPWGNRAIRSIGRWFSHTGEAFGHDFRRAGGTAEEMFFDRRTRDYSNDAR